MSKYPAQIDTDAELPAVTDNVTEIGGELINAIRDAIFILEQTLGTDPQGTANSLKDRLGTSLEEDGTLKSSALVASGLIALPIVNSQVGATAAIEESKLDLDVGSQDLQDQVSSNDTDIVEIQSDLSALTNRHARHVNGQAERHDSTHVDVIGGLTGETSLTTVRLAIDHVWNTFLAHRAATSGVEHAASAISYTPSTVITATNVQDAIDEIDENFVEDRRKHNDSAHSNGVSGDGYLNLNGQATINDGSANLTRYENVPNMIQIGQLNSASVKSKEFSPAGLGTGAENLDLTVTIGTGSRSLSVLGLKRVTSGGSLAYPSGSDRANLLAVVTFLNSEFETSHFPVSAYAARDGELILQHNIARDDCTLTLETPASDSALGPLGFSAIADTEVAREEIYFLHVNGTPFTGLKTISDGYSTQSSASAVINIGEDVTVSGLDLRNNSLIHIYNHTTASANGTYVIDLVAPAGSQTLQINGVLPIGSYNYLLYDDIFDANLGGSSLVLDLALDTTLTSSTTERMQVTSPALSGVRVVEVSQDFPAATGAFVTVDRVGTIYSMSTTIGADTSITTSFDQGFLGYLKVFAPDNKAYITVFVFDPTPDPPTPGTIADTVNFSAATLQDDEILLGTTFYFSSGAEQEYPLDRRNIGLSGLTAIGTDFTEGVIERDLSNLRSSGVVRGLDVLQINPSNTSIELSGGFAYIDGKAICKERQDIEVTNYANSDSTWNLILTREGNFEIHEDTAVGLTVADALETDLFILIAQITVSGSIVTATADARFFINDADSRLQLTVDDRELGAGSFRSLEAAILYSRFAPNDSKPEITILSDLTISADLTLDSASRIVSFGDITMVGADLTVSSDAEFEVFGLFTTDSRAIVGTSGVLSLQGGSAFTVDFISIELGANAKLGLGGSHTMRKIEISGSNISIEGNRQHPTVTFDGSFNGIDVLTGSSNIAIQQTDFVMTSTGAAVPIINVDNSQDILIDECEFAQTLPLTSITTRTGISQTGTTARLAIRNSKFTQMGAAVRSVATTDTINGGLFDSNRFDSGGLGLSFGIATDIFIAKNVFLDGYTYIGLRGASNTDQRFLIDGNRFSGSDVNADTYVVLSSNDVDDITFSNNLVENVTNAILLSYFGGGLIITGNQFIGCTTTSNAISISGGTGTVIANNNITDHTGLALFASAAAVTGNNIEATNNTGGNNVWIFNPGVDVNCAFSGNRIVLATTNDVVFFSNCNVTGNDIQTGTLVVNSANFAANVTGNTIRTLRSTGTTYGVNLQVTNTTQQFIFNSNRVESVNTTSAVLANSGRYTISDNSISTAGTNCLTVGDGSFASTESYVVSGNLIENGDTRGIFLRCVNAAVHDNFTFGTYGGGGGDIIADVGADDISITNNFIDGSGGDPRLVFSTGTPTNLYIGMNKNVAERRAFSPFGSHQDGTWTLSADEAFRSSTSGDIIYIPLHNLPVGTTLTSVEAHVSNNNAGTNGSIDVFDRADGAMTTALLSSGTDGLPTGVYSTVVVSTAAEIEDGREYFVKIEITANVGTPIEIGQMVAVITY